MNDHGMLSEEQLDFLCEMMNIAVGNAATGLSQMLHRAVNMEIPAVYVLPSEKAPSFLADPSLPVSCVKMSMVGDIAGDLFFLVREEQKVKLIRLAEQAMGVVTRDGADIDLSALAEIANIIGGIFLTAIHDFCKLNIYHTVPILAEDMVQSLLDESLATVTRQGQKVLLIENVFVLDENGKNPITTFLLVVPTAESIQTLVNSIREARKMYGSQ